MPAPYRHILYLRFPYLSASRIRRHYDGDSPLAMIQQLRGIDMVAALCPRAMAQGIAVGMRLADARALCPNLATYDFDPAADQADLYHLALWAQRYSPLTAPDNDGVVLDIAGAEHLFGGIRSLLADCARRLCHNGLKPVMATAPNYAAAWALAHYGRPRQRFMAAPKEEGDAAMMVACLTSRARLRHHLAPLPVAALRLEPAVTAQMYRAGLRVIGDIIGLARAPLTARFGAGLLQRLDQALGDCDDSFSPISRPQPLCVYRHFAEPIAAAEDIGLMIRHLAKDMAALLQQARLATRRLRLCWQYVDGMVFAKDIHLSRPSRDLALFKRLLANMDESIRPEFGIENSWMQAYDCSPLAPLDDALPHLAGHRDRADEDPYAGLVDRLVSRLGYGAVVRLAPRDSWQPEAAQSLELPDLSRLCCDNRRWLSTSSCQTASPRPIRLLAHPQPVDVTALLPDHPPVRFVWRRKIYNIIHATGPERIGPVWWRAPKDSLTRDYFRLRDDHGAGFWVYREGLPERGERPVWYIHGFFA